MVPGIPVRTSVRVLGSSCSRFQCFGSGTGFRQTTIRMACSLLSQLNMDSAWRASTSLAISAVPPAGMVTMASRRSLCTGYSFMMP